MSRLESGVGEEMVATCDTVRVFACSYFGAIVFELGELDTLGVGGWLGIQCQCDVYELFICWCEVSSYECVL